MNRSYLDMHGLVFETEPCMSKYDIYIYIWDSFHENGPSFIYIKCYKNASRLNRYIFRTVKGINFLFSTLHTIAFVYRKIHFGVLHLLRISTATFDTPPGSNPP